LPTAATRLVGRELETAAVVTRLRSPEVRLLTLTGPGGIGKTRLALAAAEILRCETEAVYFVSLASITDVNLVAAAIAQAVGMPDVGNNLRDNLRVFLGDRRGLLVLDNFEHLLPAAALVSELLSEAASLKVLVTSRELLRLSLEQTYEVPPLRLPELAALPPPERLRENAAVWLFIQRAQAVKGVFHLSNDNARSVAEICHRLDGLPLAIEFAAARVRHLEPEALLPRLERRLSLLTGGARDVPRRQQTLRGTIAWSYDLLTAAEQALFRRLAVFAGGFPLEAVEAVCQFESSDEFPLVLDGVGSLIDKSLIQRDAGSGSLPRYTMLETVREYALEQLVATDEESLAHQRHVAYYEGLVYEAAPHFLRVDQLEWLARIEAELDNVRVVLQWLLDHDERERGQRLAASLWYFWSIHLSEGRDWLTRLLDGPSGHTTSARVRAQSLFALGLTAARQYDLAAEQTAFAESLELAEAAGDAWTTAMVLMRLTQTVRNTTAWNGSSGLEDVRPAQAKLFEQALCIFRGLRDDWGVALCLTFYANFHAETEPARARELAAEATTIAERLGERYIRHQALSALALVDLECGELSAARERMEKATSLALEINDQFNVSHRTVRLAHLEMDESRFASALDLYERAVSNYRLIGNRLRLAQVLHDAGVAARLVGAAGGARAAFEESLELWQSVGDASGVAAVRASLSHLYLQQGAIIDATSLIRLSLEELRRQSAELGIASAVCGIGRLAEMCDAPELAWRLLGAAEGLLDRLRAGPYALEMRRSQHGPRRHQFHRDSTHVRELRALVEANQPPTFEAALEAGRALSTQQTVSLAIELAAQFAKADRLKLEVWPASR
jgi:predicted ATPase